MKMFYVAAALLALSACQDEPSGSSAEPALLTDKAALESGLNCLPFEYPEHEVVLLVHGTFTYGEEQFSWNYQPWLRNLGFDVCVVSYQERGLADMQVSVEYLVHAVRQIHQQTGRMVDLIGHSQGGLMPRWAIKFWPETVRAVIDDFVLLASPNHGTDAARLIDLGTPMPAAFYQFHPDSEFIRVLNAGDETPGEIDYSSIYTLYDELVMPQTPVSTSALDLGQDNPRVSNILLQDYCPLNLSEHAGIGLTDTVAAVLALDALIHPGPADPQRLNMEEICAQPSFVLNPQSLPGLVDAGSDFFGYFPGQENFVTAEPALRDYAQP